MFGDYVIERKLGSGGMGSVYLANNLSIEQSVAIKVLHTDAAEHDETVQRFNREAKTIARLTHPNIIRVFIFGRTPEGLIYLAMEYVEGPSLRDLLVEKKQLSELHSIYIVKQMLGALAEAHDLGIIHRDLKPDNILLTRYRGNPEFVKVVDFGIAKVQEPGESQLTQAGVVYGTPEYLSPEQAQALDLDGRSDLYSVGAILWELLAGRSPFVADTAMAVLVQHVYDPPPDIRQFNPKLSPQMVEILNKSLAKAPNDRFANADEFLSVLESCERDLEQSKVVLTPDPTIAAVKTQLWMPPPGFIEASQTPNPQHAAAGVMPTQPDAQTGWTEQQQAAYAAPQQVAHHQTALVDPQGSDSRRKAMSLLTIGVFLLVVLLGIAVVLLAGQN